MLRCPTALALKCPLRFHVLRDFGMSRAICIREKASGGQKPVHSAGCEQSAIQRTSIVGGSSSPERHRESPRHNRTSHDTPQHSPRKTAHGTTLLGRQRHVTEVQALRDKRNRIRADFFLHTLNYPIFSTLPRNTLIGTGGALTRRAQWLCSNVPSRGTQGSSSKHSFSLSRAEGTG